MMLKLAGFLFVGVWVPIILFLFYIGFTDSFISDRFFKWEFISLGVIFLAGLFAMLGMLGEV